MLLFRLSYSLPTEEEVEVGYPRESEEELQQRLIQLLNLPSKPTLPMPGEELGFVESKAADKPTVSEVVRYNCIQVHSESILLVNCARGRISLWIVRLLPEHSPLSLCTNGWISIWS